MNFEGKSGSAPLEGNKPLDASSFKSSTIPEPKVSKNKYQCPVCNQVFNKKENYYVHARNVHKAGSAISTPIY